jgi:hypothetical protein
VDRGVRGLKPLVVGRKTEGALCRPPQEPVTSGVSPMAITSYGCVPTLGAYRSHTASGFLLFFSVPGRVRLEEEVNKSPRVFHTHIKAKD